MKQLDNKVAIVTGAAAGLGKAIAIQFALHGAKVLATDYNEETLKEFKKEISSKSLPIAVFKGDISLESDVDAMIKAAVDQYGTVDILVNNAGVMDDFSPVGYVTDAKWERVMKINVDGPMRAMRGVLKIMLAKGAGVILNIASIGGLQGGRAGAAYTTSKHALIGLSKNTGYLYSKSGIRCNAIAPGAMDTDIVKGMDFSKLPAVEIFNDRISPGMALNPRTSQPREVANLAVFLASDDASFLNASVVVADGGWTGY
ncbi:KR domain-containing protein [Chryseotalea sanaruensis]|uniref:KR domain-containing protein n=1 Tax=Chryseotalea sanaruensis TaxID=2482724 RepID=A0A401U697_9BACT|nr:SDR family oxidoreductase [Chryseotalea sanaruensis]GCC50407.1 KR domain-containing protein [Chryseotalea sanaruensis]